MISWILILDRTLETIMGHLNEIKSQNRWLIAFFKGVNQSKLDDCINRLTFALEKFNVRLHDLFKTTLSMDAGTQGIERSA
jgi:hypothetical protein